MLRPVTRLWLPNRSLKYREAPPPMKVPNWVLPTAREGWPTYVSDRRGLYWCSGNSVWDGSPLLGSFRRFTSVSSVRCKGGNTAALASGCPYGRYATDGSGTTDSGASMAYKSYPLERNRLYISRPERWATERAGLVAVIPLTPVNRSVSRFTWPVARVSR